MFNEVKPKKSWSIVDLIAVVNVDLIAVVNVDLIAVVNIDFSFKYPNVNYDESQQHHKKAELPSSALDLRNLTSLPKSK